MIKVKDLSCGYGNGEILKGVSLSLNEGELSVLAGPNGAGKSTLLFALMGFLKQGGGKIELYERDLKSYKRSELAKLIAFVPQESQFQFDHRVFDVILMGRYPYLGLMQSWTKEDYGVVEGVLESLKLSALAQRFYSELSGGEKQRVLIARALAQNTRYIFLDESLSQLDINHQTESMELLRQIQLGQKKGILIISHNLNLAANYASQMIFLKSGHIIGQGSAAQMMVPAKLQELFDMPLDTMIHPQSGIPNIVYPAPEQNQRL